MQCCSMVQLQNTKIMQEAHISQFRLIADLISVEVSSKVWLKMKHESSRITQTKGSLHLEKKSVWKFWTKNGGTHTT